MTDYRAALKATDPEIYETLIGEEKRQREGVEMIPSENYTFPEVYAALGSAFTNKYAEGYPGRRYYGGTEFVDVMENLARDRAKEIFRAEHANVQPLSGSPMNQAVYLGFIEPGATILAMDLSHGGHLTHGAPVSHMGKIYRFVRYKTNPENGAIDFDQLRDVARKEKPKLVVCGYSSYPRDYDYKLFKQVADEVGALTMADVSHIGGLIAGGVMRNPMDAGFDFMTTTTHKSLRGPRGGLIVCKKDHAKAIDQSVFPGLQGGPHMNQVAATAVTLKLAAQPSFKAYAGQVLKNAKALATELSNAGVHLVTGGTDNHLLVIDVIKSFDINGAIAEKALDHAGMTTNKQVIPDDPNPPLRPSGVRLGTPAATTRGMKEGEMKQIARIMVEAMKNYGDPKRLEGLRQETRVMCSRFPGAWPLMPLRLRIETARLTLVPISTRWTDDLHRLFNEPVVAQWLFLTGPPTLEEVEARTKGHEAVWQQRGYGMFAVTEKATDRFVARVGAMVTPETGRVEIAWSTVTEAHGKGYASEAAKASIDFTFAISNLEALDCYLRPDNTASRRVAEKVGFSYKDTRFLYDRPLRYYKMARP